MKYPDLGMTHADFAVCTMDMLGWVSRGVETPRSGPEIARPSQALVE